MIKKLTSFSLSVFCIAGLSACVVPSSSPTGYGYHDDTYKSPNPPESMKITAMQRSTMGVQQAAQFRLATFSLVDNLTNRAGLPPKPVFVMTPEKMTPFYANMDNDLRESLRHLGYRLADTPDNAYVITYNATIIKPEKKDKNAPLSVAPDTHDDATKPNVVMAIHVHDGIGEDSKILTQEEGAFYVQGADVMTIPYASFSGVPIPMPSNEYRTVPVIMNEE